MKKYLIAIMAVFVVSMIGIVITTGILEKKKGVEDGVFSMETIRNTFRVDKNTIEKQRQTVEEKDNSGAFLADVDTTVVNDITADEGGQSEGSDTEFFHASILTEKDLKTREEYGINRDSIIETFAENNGNYCYDTMDESLHQLYAEILMAIRNRAEEVPLCTRSQDELDFAYRCVLDDHPEIFAVTGYTCVLHSANDTPVKTAFTAKYTMSATDEERALSQIRKYVSDYKSGISVSASDYEKVKYTYKFLIDNTEYVLDSKDNQNICSVMIYHQSVCLGYAKAMQYLLGEVGIRSTVVEGFAASGEPHAWNMVHIDNAYYYVDVTWGDSSYTNGNSAVRLLNGVNYDYLNITTEELSFTHEIDNVVPVPQCVDIADNYYVKEGLYFDNVNKNALSLIFKTAIEDGEDHITIKCSNDAVYQEMKYYLLDEQRIFDYMPEGTESLSYGENTDMHTITFLIKQQQE